MLAVVRNLLIGLLFPLSLFAASETVTLYDFTSKHTETPMGTVTLTDSSKGLVIKTDLSGFTPGEQGFHVHEHASCADKGMAAGGHLDPAKTQKHLGPYKNGHLGDLPVLTLSLIHI